MPAAVAERREVYEVRRDTEVVRHRRVSEKSKTRCGLQISDDWPDEVPDPPRRYKHMINVWTCGPCHPKGVPS